MRPGFIYMNPNPISNPWYEKTRPHRVADTLTTIDLLGFECFEHVSYSPDCTSVYVAVFAEVGFTWETIH